MNRKGITVEGTNIPGVFKINGKVYDLLCDFDTYANTYANNGRGIYMERGGTDAVLLIYGGGKVNRAICGRFSTDPNNVGKLLDYIERTSTHIDTYAEPDMSQYLSAERKAGRTYPSIESQLNLRYPSPFAQFCNRLRLDRKLAIRLDDRAAVPVNYIPWDGKKKYWLPDEAADRKERPLPEQPVPSKTAEVNLPVVGCIEYLSPSGKVAERNEYDNAEDFVRDIKESNYFGESMSITVYKDPKTGEHIDTSWLKDMDPPPQGFKIEEYRGGQENELTVPETEEQEIEAAEIPEEDFEMEM